MLGKREGMMATAFACAFLIQAPVDSAAAEGVGKDCIDTLYGMSHLVSQPPELPVWSRDGDHLAFVWDQKGGSAADIWVYQTSSGRKRRVSDFAPGGRDLSIEALQWLDEHRLLYLREGGLYWVELDGEGGSIPTPDGEMKYLAVSPDASRIAFAAEDKLWISELSGANEPRQVYAADGDSVVVESVKWSGDSEALAFVVADDDSSPLIDIPYSVGGEQHLHSVVRPFPGDATTRRHIGVFDVAAGRVKWVERRDPEDLVWHYEWAVHKQSLLVDSSDFLARNRQVTVHDIAGETARVHYSSSGHSGSYRPYWSASWAPEDQGLIIQSDHEGFYHLYYQSGPGEPLRPLSEGRWEVASFEIDRRNGYVYFTANRDHIADRQIYRVALEPLSAVEMISDAPGTYAPSYSPTFNHLAFSFSDDSTSPELYHQVLSGGGSNEKRRLTQSARSESNQFDWANVEYTEFKSHVDNMPLHGRVYLPRDFTANNKYPLIVGSVYSDTVRNQWGGRSVHPTWGLDQCLVSRGYLVLSVNVRGSWGQGRAFRQSLDEFGGIDVDDIESGVRHLASKGYIDARRVAIWGSSYGGLMTAMSLFKKPGVYAAGIAGAPATNVWHAFPGEMRVMGEPSGADYPARYRRQSALYHAEGLQDALMIVHGTKDHVVLYSDSIALAERLISSGKAFELVTLPGIGHSWDNENLATTRFAFKKMIEFFDRHLMK